MTVSAFRGGRSGLARLVSSPPYFFNTLVPLNPFFHKHQGDGSLWQLESGNEGSTAGWKKDSPHSRAERPVSKRWPSALRARRPWTSRSKPLSLSLPHPGNGARTSTPIVGRAKQVCKRSVRHAAGAPRPGSMSGHTADPPRAQGAAAHLGLLFPSAWKTAVGVHPTNTSGGLGTSRLLGRSKCKQFGDGIGMRPRPSTSAAGAMRPGSCSQRPLANEQERTECARVLICLGTSGQVFKVGTKQKEHPPILRRVKTKPRTRQGQKMQRRRASEAEREARKEQEAPRVTARDKNAEEAGGERPQREAPSGAETGVA